MRGHDLPWAFAYKVWFEPWIAFYPLSEEGAFAPGLRFLKLCQERAANSNSLEVGKIGGSLIYNRLNQLCFTRDRLLNFYYLLLHGAFAHAAVLVNGLLNLGVDAKRVSARNPEFLKLLNARAPGLYAVFLNPTHTAFINRVATVRHVAAHRGVITPTKLLQKPDVEPTLGELDEDIQEAGLDWILTTFPPSPARDQFREMLAQQCPNGSLGAGNLNGRCDPGGVGREMELHTSANRYIGGTLNVARSSSMMPSLNVQRYCDLESSIIESFWKPKIAREGC